MQMLIDASIYHFLNLTKKTIYFLKTIENIPNTPID